MANYPTATVSITFQTSTTDEDAVLVAELLAEDNGGTTTFVFGGTAPKFRVYKSNNISSVRMFSSDGNTARTASNRNAEFTEALTFVGAASEDGDSNNSYRQSSVSKPVKGSYSVSNIIGNIGSVSLVELGKTTFQCSKVSTGPLDPVVGFCRVTYNTLYDWYELSGVGMPSGFGENEFTSYSVIVYIVGIVG